MADGAAIAQQAISAVNGVLGSGFISAIMQKKENQRQRDWEREFYDIQKADNLSFWNMENEYNSPAMQMQRYKDAGINPNFIYGSANAVGGNITSPSQSASNSTKTADVKPQLPNLDNLYAFQKDRAQIDLLREQVQTQNTVQELNAVNTTLNSMRSEREKLGVQYDRETMDERIEQAELARDNLLKDLTVKDSQIRSYDTSSGVNQANEKKIIDDNLREWQLQGLKLSQAAANVANTKASTAERQANVNLTNTNTQYTKEKVLSERIMQELHIIDSELGKRGQTRSDSGLNRLVKSVLDGVAGSDQKQVQTAIELIKKRLKIN